MVNASSSDGAHHQSGFASARDRETIAATAYGFDRLERAVGVEFLAQATDEHFEDVRIAVEVLLINMLGQIGFRDQFARMHHQILQHLVFVAGQIDVLAADSDGLRGEVECDRATLIYDDQAAQKLVVSENGRDRAIAIASDLPLNILVSEFAAAIVARKCDLSSLELGVAVVEVLEACAKAVLARVPRRRPAG